MRYRFLTATLSCLALLAAAACGGGGGGGGSGSANVQITQANSRAAASTALNGSQAATSLGGSGSAAYRSTLEGTRQTRFDLPRFLKRQLEVAARGSVLNATITETFPGLISGSIDSVWQDNDNNEVESTGDTFALTYNAFDDGDGVVISGTEAIDNVIITGDLETSFTFQATFTYNLNVTEAGTTAPFSGKATVSVTGSPAQFVFRFTVLNTLSDGETSLNPGSVLQSTETDTTFTDTQQGSVTDPDFGGTVTFETTTPFSGNLADENPSAGVLVVSGTGNSKLRVIAQNNTNVTIEVDADGDGTFEFSETITWVALDELFDN